MSDLKLPLTISKRADYRYVIHGQDSGCSIAIEDPNGENPAALRHIAEVIVAALEADAEDAAHPWKLIAHGRTEKPNAEKETKGE